MKLWEIKAQALRLMFADSEITFSYEDFKQGVIEDNANTREKLIRMDDSIKRAIDMYYSYCGNINKKVKVKYKENTYLLDIDDIEDFGYPTRVDLVRKSRVIGQEKLDYHYDSLVKEIEVVFDNIEHLTDLEKQDLDFLLYYEMKRYNLPDNFDKIEYDLDDIFIPQDIQRQIPKYIKGELYEEDEPSMAMISKNEYLGYLVNRQKDFSVAQNKVKSKFRRG
ncbi:MAG TPA: hypothetical protein PL042_04640 [Caldisericia bacterium]|jgi:hypothetical protein|nr:hypothetical protein [Caldisericia bacterium]